MKLSINSVQRLTSFCFLAFLSTGCVTMPESIQNESAENISVQDVQQNSPNYKGQTVRWGGVITQVINNETDTWVEVLALDLSESGKPKNSRLNSRLSNNGRFIVKIDQFLDPEVYQQGYSFTVVGQLADKIDGKIGEFKYSYPVIEAQGHHIWPKISYNPRHYVNPGFWYYGFHSHWHFGYSYYGYGVRYGHGYYYPYYPFYGYMRARTTAVSRSSNMSPFAPSNDDLWNRNTRRITAKWRKQQAEYAINQQRYLDRQVASRTQQSSKASGSTRKTSKSNTRRQTRPQARQARPQKKMARNLD